MVYPDIYCWDNEGDIDETGFNTNTGLLPTAIKAMIDRVTGLTSPSANSRSCTAEESTGGGRSPPSPDDSGDRSPRPDGDDRPPRPEIPDGELPPWMTDDELPPWMTDDGALPPWLTD